MYLYHIYNSANQVIDFCSETVKIVSKRSVRKTGKNIYRETGHSVGKIVFLKSINRLKLRLVKKVQLEVVAIQSIIV